MEGTAAPHQHGFVETDIDEMPTKPPSRWIQAVPTWVPVVVVVVGAIVNATVNWVSFGNGIANNSLAIAQEKADRVKAEGEAKDRMNTFDTKLDKFGTTVSEMHDAIIEIRDDLRWMRAQKGPQ
jgi:hypothetical protein